MELINSWNDVEAITELTFIIQDETGFDLALKIGRAHV